MREIKFRTYCQVCQKYVNAYDGFLYKDGLAFQCPKHDVHTLCLLEQFTGLQDSKGRDIYEGDIVRTGNMAIGVVYFDIKKQGYLFDCSKGWCHPIYGMGGKKEIIGNIHDNPELLEGK